MDKIFNNEIVDSAKKAVQDKLDSSVYGIFIMYWFIFHWRFVYSVFFTSEDMIWQSMHLFKNDYLVKTFFQYNTFWFWFWFVMPILFTFLSIWCFPRWFVIRSYKRELDDEHEKTVFKIQKQIDLEKEKIKLEKQESQKLDVIVEKVEKEKIIKAAEPTNEWEYEYQELKKRAIFSHFRTLYQMVYENSGATYGQQSYRSAMPLVAYLNSIEALSLNDQIIRLTSKGNFFMRRYLEEIS